MNAFTLREMIINGWPVLSVLLVMSILSLAVIWDRDVAVKRARLNARAFVLEILKLIDAQGIPRALEHCRALNKPLAAVAADILAQAGGRAAKQRAFENAAESEVHKLEAHIHLLGTVGSTAPFVGLFGTVMGIIRAFQDIAINLGGGPEVVAGGIAEALITTAFGLLVAIPAVMGYNHFVHKIEALSNDMDRVCYAVIEKLHGEDASA